LQITRCAISFPTSCTRGPAPGERITSAHLRIEARHETEILRGKMEDWFARESLASSEVLDGAAVIAGDFHIDPAGHTRFAVFVGDGVGQGRTGRIVQRLFEIETYKTMSMLGFAKVREMGPHLGELDAKLSRLMEAMNAERDAARNCCGPAWMWTALLRTKSFWKA